MAGIRTAVLDCARRVRSSLLGSLVAVDTEQKAVALTFDDGPHPEFTPRLLEVLRKHDARATFFMLGVQAEKHPDIVKRVVDEGHEIGNHSWDHPSFPTISAGAIGKQISRTRAALAPEGKRWFRPPFGHQDFPAFASSWLRGYEVVAWNVSADDWLGHDAERLAEGLLEKVAPGSIVLLHDSLFHVLDPEFTDRNATIDAVELLVKGLGKEYRFLTLSRLFSLGKPVRQFRFARPDREWMSSPAS